MVNNTKYGSGALQNNTGTNNTAVGAYTAYNNLDASNNTAVGSNSSFFNTTGSNNTALGAGSLCNNTSGDLNTAIGSSALEGVVGQSVGNENVAVGAQALYQNQGDLNTAIGSYAAEGVTGSYNTFLGANTTFDDVTSSYQYSTAIGYGAQITDSNQIMMGGTGAGSYPTVVIPGLANYTTYQPGDYTENTLVSKEYVDTFVSGLSIQNPVWAISNSNISGTYSNTSPGTITGVGSLTVDGVPISDSSAVLLNGQSNSLQNGVYIWSQPNSGTLTRRTGMQTGNSALAAYIFVRQGTVNARTAWVQSNNPAIVGTNDLSFNLFNTFDYELGRGLDVENTGGKTTINVDTSLNFINYLDSTLGVTGASGILNIGNNTNQTIIGPTGSPYNSVIFTSGITGPTGSFQNLIVTNQIKAPGGITGATGSFTYLSSSQGITGPTGSFQNLIVNGSTTTGTLTSNQSASLAYNSGNVTVGSGNNPNSSLYVSGNVGIGTSNPLCALDVSGNYIQSLGNLYTNSFSPNGYLIPSSLTFDASNTNTMYLNTYLVMTGGSVANWNNIEPRLQLFIDATYQSYISFNPPNGDNYGELALGYNNTGSINSNTEVMRISRNGYVGIGTTTPNYTLDVSGNVNIRGSLYFNSNINQYLMSVTGNTINYNASENHVFYISNNEIGRFTSNGLGIGNPNPSYPLDVSGNGNFTGQVSASSFNSTSDYRIKENVIPLNDTFTVDKLVPVTYKNIKTDKQDIGLIAHELQEQYPYLVNGVKDGINLQTVNYTGLIGILIKEIKDLKERVKSLENKTI